MGKLFDYISGSNSENENIDMTTPESTKWLRIDENTVEHEECFFLNKEHQNNPPEPSASDVYIVSRPAMTIYTRILTKNFWHQMKSTLMVTMVQCHLNKEVNCGK